MGSQKDKLEQDAQRMRTRSFAGYLADRGMGKADFAKGKAAADSAAATAGPIGSANPANAEALKAAGMKSGGRVRATGYRGYGAARKV